MCSSSAGAGGAGGKIPSGDLGRPHVLCLTAQLQPMANSGSAERNGSPDRERSLVVKRGAQVPYRREQPRPDLALEQLGAELEGGPAAADDDGLGSVAG